MKNLENLTIYGGQKLKETDFQEFKGEKMKQLCLFDSQKIMVQSIQPYPEITSLNISQNPSLSSLEQMPSMPKLQYLIA